MENWREGARSGHTHDPNEVTVQIDGVGRQLKDPAVPADGQDGSDGPVFVDESGSRSRRLRRIGWVLGLACTAYAAVLGVSLLSGRSDAPWMPGLGDKRGEPAGRVEPSPTPTFLRDGEPAADTTPAAGGPSGTGPSGEGPSGEGPRVESVGGGAGRSAPKRPDGPSAPAGSPEAEPGEGSGGTDPGSGSESGSGSGSDPEPGSGSGGTGGGPAPVDPRPEPTDDPPPPSPEPGPGTSPEPHPEPTRETTPPVDVPASPAIEATEAAEAAAR
ncbi:hypothetical protein [Streptomyces cavernicola]|uniref:Translation initiation factor IF-2 n=1 Tax=Streptomyces cavernicola TaxID=3043613 RepID=A0ABT6SL00_9ACTN|nr:hypothetical protein [Streptomyces sp. B-S-A6]MDI3408871.1 hypothetical protein [Streptomyces sp. B-S-A6]